jgi:translation initiation factor 2 subunit 3
MVNFYGRDLPSVGDLVVCRVENIIPDAGFMVELLEYDNRMGFIGFKDLTQMKWTKNVKRLANVGDVEVLEVTCVGNGGEIDLTKRNLDEDDKSAAMGKYRHWKRVYDYLFKMVDPTTREEMVFKFLYPFMQSCLDSIVEDDDIDEDVTNPNVVITKSSTTISFSTWTKDNKKEITFENQTTRVILDNVTKLLEKPVEDKVQTTHISLSALENPRIEIVNWVLEELEKRFSISIQTYNTRTCTYQVSSKEKTNQDAFMKVLEKMMADLPSIIEECEQRPSKMVALDTKNEENNYQPVVNIGIVGHVAHGKTTLIEAITGTDTRSHKREIASNRTLNIGYTNAMIVKCSCGGTDSLPRYVIKKEARIDCTCPTKLVSIVDCPGHNVLLSTMITGARIMDTCILVVSASEVCPQPQTAEHVNVLHMVSRSENHFSDSIIIQNKVDLVHKKEGAIEKSLQQIEKFVDGTIFSSCPVIPASAQIRINVEYVLKFMYDYAERRMELVDKPHEQVQKSKGIVVRTFDVNKPGSTQLQGAVIGGSVLTGEFKVGDEIVLVPYGIKAKILSMKSDKYDISTAKPGGLIALQTDLNPTYCSSLVGTAFVKEIDYVAQHTIPAGEEIRVRYQILPSYPDFTKEEKITINYSGGNYEGTMSMEKKKDKKKEKSNKALLKLNRPIYVFPGEEFNFTIVHNKRLVGIGMSLDHSRYELETGHKILVDLPAYSILLSEFTEKIAEWEEFTNVQMTIPPPKIVYKNTFSTVTNFASICSHMGVSPETLGYYIYSEMGFKSWSLNGNKQLILKGRTDERKIISILQSYVMERRCMLCKKSNVRIVKNMGVRQKVCSDCPWKS